MTKISSVEGNRQKLDGGAMFGNAPRVVWEKWAPPDQKGRIELACRALLIEYEGIKILCETGIGAFFEPKLAERFGVQEPSRHLLIENLESLGIKDSDIDFVILSHLHFDHVGGLLPAYQQIAEGNDQLLFPNAKYVVGEDAWARAVKPHVRDRASFIPGLTDKLKNSKRLIITNKNSLKEYFPEEVLFFRHSHGHTPGHLHVGFRGENQTVFFCGDLVPGKAWVHVPITMGYDRFPELLIDEKTELFPTAVKENWLLFFTHDTEISAAQIVKSEAGKYGTHHELKTIRNLPF